MAYFFGYWHRAIGSKWGPLEVLVQSKFSMSNSEQLSLFRSYLPCPNSELFTVCFVGFLIFQGGFC